MVRFLHGTRCPGQPDKMRARTVSDARHASDTARPIRVGVRQCPTRGSRVGRAAALYPTRVCVHTFRSALRFLGIPRKRRFLKSAEHNIIIISGPVGSTRNAQT